MDPSSNNSTNASKSKKKNGADHSVTEDIVPLPIQTFLWRQTRLLQICPVVVVCCINNCLCTLAQFFPASQTGQTARSQLHCEYLSVCVCQSTIKWSLDFHQSKPSTQ